jgi:zinc D-Ala-D-Ala carboxypeptidase
MKHEDTSVPQMIYKNFRKLTLHFFLAIIISLFAISCQNCNTTNADNKASNINDTAIKSGKAIFELIKKDTISKEYLLGKVVPSKDTNFALVDPKYAFKKGNYLRKEAYAAFIKMYDAAKKDGINLVMLSSTRTFNEQKGIWEGKWTGNVLYYGKNIATSYPDPVERSKYVLKYSSMPGTSRHHWGTDIDMNSMELSYYKTETGKKFYKWLTENASKYDFCQPYTAKDSVRTTGYEEEKWHWSYIPLSAKFLEQYEESITYNDLKGFAGAETATKIDVIKNYVMSVNIKCK